MFIDNGQLTLLLWDFMPQYSIVFNHVRMVKMRGRVGTTKSDMYGANHFLGVQEKFLADVKIITHFRKKINVKEDSGRALSRNFRTGLTYLNFHR